MSPFMGGSAPAMAGQVADGYSLITAVQLKRVTDPEMELLRFELEKILRELRAEQVPLDDIPAIQARNRKITRVSGAIQQIQATIAKRRRSA
ncbi:MAG: hypothetical protein ACM3O7_11175 [Acidobacteriota bacterium]